MLPEKNIPKNDEGTAQKKNKETLKSKKRRRRLVKKFSNEEPVPDKSTPPLSTSEKKTPESLRPKKKKMKKSSNVNNKLGESSSALSPSKTNKETLVSPNSKGGIVKKSSNEKPMPSNLKDIQNSKNLVKKPNKPMPSNSKEIQNPQNRVKKPNKKLKAVNNNRKPEVANKGSHSGKGKEVESSSKNHSKYNDMKKIGGFIFMCNAKTKGDCYRYRVMGVQAHKKDLVMGVKPGMKLFLFDINVKLLYGIYKATSGGGMRLEPAAFGGGFPLQVRFEVHEDCLPLPESVFKKAIKESYDERTRKFKTELTVDQVKRLTNLFKPAPILHSNPPVVYEPKPTVASSSLLLTEQDYRSYGLIGADRHKNLVSAAPLAYDPYRPELEREVARTDTVYIGRPEQEPSQLVTPALTSPPVLLTEQEYRSYGLSRDRPPAYDPYKPDLERDVSHSDTVYLSRPTEQESTRSMQLPNPTLTSPVLLTEREYRSHGLRGDRPPPAYDPYDSYKTDLERKYSRAPSDSRFLSEKDYRTYGLKSRQETPPSYTPKTDATYHNPAINYHQSVPYNPFEQDSDLVERYLPQHVAPLPSSSYRYAPETVLSERVERLYPGNTSSELLSYNQNVIPRVEETEYRSVPVSSRYAFGGTSVIHR